jgi:branched-subunit amino acid aminotransferase/4-amino-4-deoxychorismate lyase
MLESYLASLAHSFDSPQRVRLLLGRAGTLTGESAPFGGGHDPQPLTARLAAQPVQSSDIFLFHKTTHRVIYESAKNACPDCDDALLYNERGELTEFTIGNLVVELDGALFTSPVACGLLPGTFRAHLLETGQVQERIIRVDELQACAKIFLVNSVRRWMKVNMAWNR